MRTRNQFMTVPVRTPIGMPGLGGKRQIEYTQTHDTITISDTIMKTRTTT